MKLGRLHSPILILQIRFRTWSMLAQRVQTLTFLRLWAALANKTLKESVYLLDSLIDHYLISPNSTMALNLKDSSRVIISGA